MPKVKKRKKDFSKHYKKHHIDPYFLESQLERQLERPSIQKADCPYNHSNSSISLNNTVIIPRPLNPRALYNEITQLAILPVGWVMSATDDILQLAYMQFTPPKLPVVTKCLTVFSQLDWQITIAGAVVPRENHSLSSLSQRIEAVSDFVSIFQGLTTWALCTGNSDMHFVETVQDILQSRNTTLPVFIDATGSIRHNACSFFVLNTTDEQCVTCHSYRCTLRAIYSKHKAITSPQKETLSITHQSHANYRWLSAHKLRLRLKSVAKALRSLSKSRQRLSMKLKRLIAKQGVDLTEEDSSDIERVVDGAYKAFSPESFEHLLLQQQKKFNSLSKKSSMRWHPLIIRFALHIQYSSSAALGQFLKLLSTRLLRDYTHWTKFQVGISASSIQCLMKEMIHEGLNPEGLKVGIIIDEMKIKSGLVFSKSSGMLLGFVDLGDVNNTLMQLENILTKSTSCLPAAELATHMLVVMVRVITRPSFSFPIAQFPTANLTGNELYPIIWGTIEALELNNLQVVSITSDGASSNCKLYRMSATKGLPVPYKVENPFRRSQSVSISFAMFLI